MHVVSTHGAAMIVYGHGGNRESDAQAHAILKSYIQVCTAGHAFVMVKRTKPLSRKRMVVPKGKRGTKYSRPLAQGVGKIPNGGIQNRKRKTAPVKIEQYMDALHDSHLPLPRAIGGYSVVRTTDYVSTDSHSLMFGAFKWNDIGRAGKWSNIIGVGSVNPTLALNAANNTFLFHAPGISQGTLGGASTLVPAAITVQLMNPEALQATSGVVMAGVMNQVPRLANETRTWNQLITDFISFNKPRLMSAGKLALRGVQVSAIPMNMSELSDFTEVIDTSVAQIAWDAFDPHGFTPIVISNVSGVTLQYLVTVEWRLRFDISHPASSTHVTHPPASEHTWATLLKRMQAFGHGVKDIADVVADIGMMAGKAPLAMI